MVKIFNNNEVYIFLKNAKEIHPDISFDIPVYTIGNTEGLIKEEDYNNILLKNNKEVTSLSVTKVQTLEAEVEAMQVLRPIKHLFLSKYGMSDEEIQKKIFKEEIENVKRFVENIEPSGTTYCEKVRYIIVNTEKAKEYLLPLGLELQFITEITDGRVGLSVFLAGKDVFYDFGFDNEICFDSFQKTETGFSFEDEWGEDTEIVIKPVNREFREYTALQNMQWVLSNMPLRSDFTDEVNCSEGGIYVSVKTELLAKCFNPNAFPETILLDGFIDIKEKLFFSAQDNHVFFL